MPNSLYDIHLGDVADIQGYRTRSFVSDAATLVAAKFSTGEPSETDLDLLKSNSVQSLAGGMFQRTHQEKNKVARAVGFYNSFDEMFYPNVPTTAPSNWIAGLVTARVESQYYGFVAYYQLSAGLYYISLNKIVAGAVFSISMPAGIFGTATKVQAVGMCLHKGQLFVATKPSTFGGSDFRYNITADTWQDIGGGSQLFFTIRDKLYAVDNASALFSVTNELAAGAATRTEITKVGGVDAAPNEAIEYNGAGWIAKDDGIYRFDGVSAIKVLKLKARFLTEYNGAIYFMAGKWLYRFDGATVQKIQYFPEQVYGLSSNTDYLFVQTWSTTTTIDSGKTLSGNGFARIYTYDGAGFSIAMEKDITTESSISHAMVVTGEYLHYNQPQHSGTAWDNAMPFAVSLANIFQAAEVSSSSLLDITTSESDEGFPNVFKSFELAEVIHAGMVNGDVITVKYQLFDGKNWGSWITAGTITYSSDSNYIEIPGNNNKLYKRIKINAYVSTMTTDSTIALKGIAWRYTLQPRVRWRWQAHIMAGGNSTVSDRAGSPITTDANALSNKLTKSAKQKTPLFMFSPDYFLVKSQINSAAVSVVMKGQIPLVTDPYNEYPLIGIKNNNGAWEILRVSAVSYDSNTDETTLTIKERGYYGVTAAQINANAEAHLAYKVYVTRLLRDAPVLDEETYTEQDTTGESQLQREFIFEITEV